MSAVLEEIGKGFWQAFQMAWEVWWALVLGFGVSAVVQAWVPRERVERALAGEGPRPLLTATALGAASSSCSYAAIAIAKSLFQKGASAASALAFQFASTNLVWELGLVLWALIGWQFALAEYVGGLILILLTALLLRLLHPRALEARARRHARAAASGHEHHAAGGGGRSWRARLTSAEAWSEVAHNFRGDWQMLYKEILAGFLLAGFIGLLGDGFLHSLFLEHGSAPLRGLENVILGPIVAMLSFVCSVGNVPLAAVLWSGGISFAGVIAFIFADLIVLPILAAYRKCYGGAVAWRMTLLMFVTIVLAALAVDGLFGLAGLVPSGARPARGAIFGGVHVDYRLYLNAAAAVLFAGLIAITLRRGARDPVCGMRVDRASALTLPLGGRTEYFCSESCRAERQRRQSAAGRQAAAGRSAADAAPSGGRGGAVDSGDAAARSGRL